MNEPSEPWVWGTSPPVVITAQVPTRGCPARAVGVASWARDVCPTANALARAPLTADARTERRRMMNLLWFLSGCHHGSREGASSHRSSPGAVRWGAQPAAATALQNVRESAE